MTTITVVIMKTPGYTFQGNHFTNGGKFSWLVHENLLKQHLSGHILDI